MALIQFAPQSLRVPHGGHRLCLCLRLGQRGVSFQKNVPVIFQVGGQLGGNGVVIRPEADPAAHLSAELPDRGLGHAGGVHQAMAGADPASTAFTAWEKEAHSSFFSPNRRSPFFVM